MIVTDLDTFSDSTRKITAVVGNGEMGELRFGQSCMTTKIFGQVIKCRHGRAARCWHFYPAITVTGQPTKKNEREKNIGHCVMCVRALVTKKKMTKSR